VRKALLDTSTYLDLRRAGKSRRQLWAQNTLRHAIAYRDEYPKLTISAYTVFEALEGIYRDAIPGADEEFITKVLPGFEIVYPDQKVLALGAKINATLAVGRQSIGIVDALIAATAIHHDLTLVMANTRHFPRVIAAGFPLTLTNWREA